MKALNYIYKIKSAKEWLLNSGIQNMNRLHKGGFNAWYDTITKQYPFVYSEITGYGISTLLYLNEVQSNPELVERACLAANWLKKTAYIENKSVVCRFYYAAEESEPRLCTFDAGMCLKALVSLYRQTRKKTYLKFSQKIADWLIQDMQKEDGSFYARYLLDEGRLIDNENQWSAQSGSFHAKVAIGLLHLGFLTTHPVYIESADKICKWALQMQQKNGRFITNTKDGSTFLQPHCYSIEGILCGGVFLRKREYLDSAVNGIKWIMSHQLPNGSFPTYFTQSTGKFSSKESADMSAQVVRLMFILSQLGELTLNMKSVEKAVKRLFDFQCIKEKSKKIHGGFLAGPAWFQSDYKPHVNSWVTMFVLQAAQMHIDRSQDELKFNIFSLI